MNISVNKNNDTKNHFFQNFDNFDFGDFLLLNNMKNNKMWKQQ